MTKHFEYDGFLNFDFIKYLIPDTFVISISDIFVPI